ncbi:hypothetical protein KQI65_06590 [bacterium]|nr:hypothetical protein [bacterium]
MLPSVTGTHSITEARTHSLSKRGIDELGGAYLPFKGRIRGLVTFIQMKNDDVADLAWPNGRLPNWSNMFAERMHRYFEEMSGGQMDLQLDVYPHLLTTPHTETNYLDWGENYGTVIRRLIDTLDTQMSFEDYDNWDSQGVPFSVEEGPDGQVDLLIVIFRSISNAGFLPFSGISDLGFPGYAFVDGSLDRFFYGGSGEWNDARASGLTISYLPGYKAVMNDDFAFRVTTHELGHKLFGEAHPAELYGGLGVMASSSNGYGMCSFERQLAGYLDYRMLDPGRDTTVVLKDYLTEDDAVLLPVAEQSRSYYALEYRSKRSQWDGAPVEGLYIYRIYNSSSMNQNRVVVVSAEGSFTWSLDESTGKIYPVAPQPVGGYNRLQRIPVNNGVYWADGWEGDERVAFSMKRSELCALKNPSPDFIFSNDTIRTNLHIRLLSITDSAATVQISYQYPTILDADQPLAATVRIESPFPHPVRSGTTAILPFTLDRPGHYTLSLLDVLGRRVQVVEGFAATAGQQTSELSTAGLQAGTFMLLLETDVQRLTRPLLITQ